MKPMTCDSCGRINGRNAPMTGWFIEIPNHVNDPWLAACSEKCVEDLDRDSRFLDS
jgi:hypothetical protein